MSAPHFPALPVMALQLAVLVERYRHGIEADASQAPGGPLPEAAALAHVLPPLWADWGQLMVAHNEFAQHVLHDAPPEPTGNALRRLRTTAHMFASRCVHWALFEQARPSVPFHTADAFIAWEGARRSAWQLREQVEQLAAESPTRELPKALDDIAAQAERNANRLLVQAVVFLEGNAGAAAEPAD